jgi:nucleoside-diphosphate-sugar epimerase
MSKIVILGGGGYIGSRLKIDLGRDHDVTAVDTGWFSDDKFGFIEEDFKNLTKEFLQPFECVILLAGHSSVNMCQGEIKDAFRNNVQNFLSLISKLSPKQKFIYASSSSVYGNSGSEKVDELYTDFIPHNHYDITKHIIDLYMPKFDVEYYGLRFGTVNGYSQKMRSDVMINSMIYNGKTNGHIKLYIKDVMRPILGISDLSLAVQKIISLKEDKRGIYNLASFNMTAEEIANGVSKITGFKIQEINTESTPSTNSKLQTKSYNFSIDCSKFEKNFDFKFSDTVESISEEIISNFDRIIFSNRSNVKEYK